MPVFPFRIAFLSDCEQAIDRPWVIIILGLSQIYRFMNQAIEHYIFDLHTHGLSLIEYAFTTKKIY